MIDICLHPIPKMALQRTDKSNRFGHQRERAFHGVHTTWRLDVAAQSSGKYYCYIIYPGIILANADLLIGEISKV